jgi:hypothetical protein
VFHPVIRSSFPRKRESSAWVPAFAGTTGLNALYSKDNSLVAVRAVRPDEWSKATLSFAIIAPSILIRLAPFKTRSAKYMSKKSHLARMMAKALAWAMMPASRPGRLDTRDDQHRQPHGLRRNARRRVGDRRMRRKVPRGGGDCRVCRRGAGVAAASGMTVLTVMKMPTLTLGTRSYDVGEGRVIRQAVRMSKMSPERRGHRIDRAKTVLARSARDTDAPGAMAAEKRAAAILLSQGIDTI